MKPNYFAVLALCALTSAAQAFETSVGTLTVTEVANGLDEPWALGFLPDGELLITQRDGILLHLTADGMRQPVSGVPQVYADGQGGLLDVMVPRDFAESREIFLSYSMAQDDGGAGTALARATLAEDGSALTDLKRIFQSARGSQGGRHFGSRIVEGTDGTIFLTIGDRGEGSSAQDLRNHNGSVIRLRRSGVTPPDNPFVGMPGSEPEIYSYGHRNPQGATLDAEGTLWVVEHGAKGGDEINKIVPGANYGWPVISYGTHYSGDKIGVGTDAPGMEQPQHYYDPSIAPSGMMIYSGKLWPDWQGDIFVGSLKFDYISRVTGAPLSEAEQLQSPQTDRVRDIREGPNGAIWFLSVGNGALYKLTP